MLVLLAGTLAGSLLWLSQAPELASFPILEPAIQLPAAPVLPPPPAPTTATRAATPRLPAIAALPALPAVARAATNRPLPTTVRQPAIQEPELQPLPVLASSHSPQVAPPLEREPQCVHFGQTSNLKFYVDAAFTPLWPSRSLSAKSPEHQQYADLREQTENPRLSFGAGARLSMVTDFGLALRSGVHFSQINEKFNYTDNSEETITITNIYGPGGEFIRTDTIVEFGAHQQTARNRYRMIDIPLIIGYELRRKNWTVAFNGGALINLSLDAQGEFYSPEEMQPLDFPSDNINTVPAYRENIGLGWFASIGLHYQLTEGLQVMVEPQFRYFPQSITHDDYVLDQRYFTSGLALGLRKQI